MPKPLTERGRLLEATTAADGTTRRKIQIITPGWGSSGYYSAEVLQEAAANKVIPAGTHMYLNHASESERTDRPEPRNAIVKQFQRFFAFDGIEQRMINDGTHAQYEGFRPLCVFLHEIIDDDLHWTGFRLPHEQKETRQPKSI